MASKLLTVKVGGLKKKYAFQPWPHSNRSARVRDHTGSNHSQSLMAGKFAALWPTDPKFSAFKDLNLFKTVHSKLGGCIFHWVQNQCYFSNNALSAYPKNLHYSGIQFLETKKFVDLEQIQVLALWCNLWTNEHRPIPSITIRSRSDAKRVDVLHSKRELGLWNGRLPLPLCSKSDAGHCSRRHAATGCCRVTIAVNSGAHAH